MQAYANTLASTPPIIHSCDKLHAWLPVSQITATAKQAKGDWVKDRTIDLKANATDNQATILANHVAAARSRCLVKKPSVEWKRKCVFSEETNKSLSHHSESQ
jgi:hypothetical protein